MSSKSELNKGSIFIQDVQSNAGTHSNGMGGELLDIRLLCEGVKDCGCFLQQRRDVFVCNEGVSFW